MKTTLDVDRMIEFVSNWYTLGRSVIPEFGTEDFGAFVGKSNAFSYEMNPDETNITIKVSKKTRTAYVDLAKREIVIGAALLTEEMYVRRFGEEVRDRIAELATAMINGAIVHENLHIKYTDTLDNIPDTLGLYPQYWTMVEKWGTGPVHSMYNIIEDMYIESQLEDKHKVWMQAANDILFSTKDLHEIELSGEWTPGEILRLVCMYKNARLRSDRMFELLPKKALELIASVCDKTAKCYQLQDRAEISFAVLECFDPPASDGSEEDGKGEDSGGSDRSDESYGELGEGMGASGAMDEILKSLDGESDKVSDDMIDAVESSSTIVSEEMSPTKTYGEGYHKASWSRLVETDVMKVTGDWAAIRPKTEIDYGFMKDLVGMRTLNRTPGAARTRGSVMVKSRLSRIATDGKIFAKRDAERKRLRRIEIIINIDLSSSTYGSVADGEVGAAMEISKVLQQANIAHSVYGHTTKSKYIPLLIHVYSYDMDTTSSNWAGRFERLTKVRLEENFDGVAIEAVSQKFTGRDAEKYIINLSDGAPSAPNYRGAPAVDHTKKEIAKARARGINVFAISVVEDVVDSNNKIYGESNNIDASKNVAAQFRNLILSIMRK